MNNEIIILGAGGHGKVVLDIFLCSEKYKVSGLIAKNRTSLMGIPVIGTDDDLGYIYKQGITKAFVAVGDNQIRYRLTSLLKENNFELVTGISHASYVSKYTSIGEGTIIMPGSIINSGASIGKGVIINTNTSIDHDDIIGNFCHIAPGSTLSGNVNVGNFSFLGTSTSVIDNITIGSNVMIGGGTTIIKDIPNNCTAVGVPAKIIRRG